MSFIVGEVEDIPDPVTPDENEQEQRLNRCRYIAFTPGDSDELPQAFRVTVKECPQFPYMETPENRTYWVGPTSGGFAGLQPELTPDCYYSTDDMILVGDNSQIVPSTNTYGDTIYTVEATYDGTTFSDPVDIPTAVWGDVYPAVLGSEGGGPDMVCEGFDILAILDCAQGVIYQTAYERSFCDLAYVDTVVEGFDILAVIDAANGDPYPDTPGYTPVPNV